MNGTVRESNVYYITPQPAPAPIALSTPPLAARLRRRLQRAWWRLRLTIADIRVAIRRPGGRLFVEDGYPPLLGGDVEIFGRRPAPAPPRRRPPAPVIDLGAARVRLRPQS